MASSRKRQPLSARVLIVDDDERNAFAASEALEVLGHELVIARSGEEALRVLLHQEFAVILLDLHMEGMSGVETLQLILQGWPEAVVIMLTVSEEAEDLATALQAGARGYLIKNIDADYLVRAKNEEKTKEVEVQIAKKEAERIAALNANAGAISYMQAQAQMKIADGIAEGKVQTVVIPYDFKGMVNVTAK